MSQTQDRKHILRNFIHDVWDCGQEGRIEQYVASRYTLHHDPGDPWDGQVLDVEGYKARLRASRAPFPDQTFDIQQLYADGDAVVMTWLWQASHLGELPGYPATGDRIHMSGATAYVFDLADRLSGHWQVVDRLNVFQQLEHNKSQVGARAKEPMSGWVTPDPISCRRPEKHGMSAARRSRGPAGPFPKDTP